MFVMDNLTAVGNLHLPFIGVVSKCKWYSPYSITVRNNGSKIKFTIPGFKPFISLPYSACHKDTKIMYGDM